VIDSGAIRYDGGLRELSARYVRQQTLTVAVGDSAPDLTGYGEVVSTEDGRISIRVAKAQTSQVAARLLREHAVTDLTIEDPPVEDVIEQLFAAAGTPAP
jgi:ABC-2 type transport system ATP-binding protein